MTQKRKTWAWHLSARRQGETEAAQVMRKQDCDLFTLT